MHFSTISTIALTLCTAVAAFAQSAPGQNAGDFLRQVEGEWIGSCKQTTDGEVAEDKYFYVVISETGENSFESKFDYYRCDPKTQALIPAGSSTITTTVSADGTATNVISGEGTVMVYEKLKTQEHNLTEVISLSPEGLLGEGSGTISVAGLPLGLGKNGKVKSAKSEWSLNDGVLSVSQTLTVGFRALFFQKNFDVVANYTARRGTDVASLIRDQTQVSSAPYVAVP